MRRTADGRLVVHHDAEIDGTGAVHALRASELPPWVPGLDEALETCAGAAVNVEVKNAPVEPGFDPAETVATEVVVDPGGALAGRRGGRPAHVIVSSFWPATLAAVHRAGPEVATGLLVHPSLDAAEAAERALSIGCVALHPFHAQVTPALVDLVHGLGMGVAAWTVNERRRRGRGGRRRGGRRDLGPGHRRPGGPGPGVTPGAVEPGSGTGLVRGAHPRGQSRP